MSQLSQLQTMGEGRRREGEKEEEEEEVEEEEEEEAMEVDGKEEGRMSASLPSFPSSSSASTFSRALRRLRDLNREACMPSFMAVIDTLAAKAAVEQQQQQQQQQQPPPKPSWVSALELALDGETGLHRNARLFVLQACLNEPTASILAPWVNEGLGGKILSTVASLLLTPPSLAASGKPSSSACHYLLCDVADTFLTAWQDYRPSPPSLPSSSFSSNELTDSTTFLCHFLTYAHDETLMPVTRRNIYFLSSLLSLWIAPPSLPASSSSSLLLRKNEALRQTFEAALFAAPPSSLPPSSSDDPSSSSNSSNSGPFASLLSLLDSPSGARGGKNQAKDSAGSRSARRRTTGVNLLAYLLTAGQINVVSSQHPALARSLLRRLLQAMQAESSLVYEVAAEVAGLLLRFLYPLSSPSSSLQKEGGKEEGGEEGREDEGGYHETNHPHPSIPDVDEHAKGLLTQIRKILLDRLTESGEGDSKKGEQGPRSLVALVAPSKGGFGELLNGDQGGKSRQFWREVVKACARVKRVSPKTMAGLLQALSEARHPPDLVLLQECHPFLPPCLTDTSRAYLRGAWRPGVQLAGVRLLGRAVREMMETKAREGGREGREETVEELRGRVAKALLGGGYLGDERKVTHR